MGRPDHQGEEKEGGVKVVVRRRKRKEDQEGVLYRIRASINL